MKNRKLTWLERIVHIVCWITIAGTAFWTVLLPYICNMGAYWGVDSPWEMALTNKRFWNNMFKLGVPTIGVFLILILALRILAQVRKGRLFCRENVRCLNWAGAAGLLMAAVTVVNVYLDMEEKASAVIYLSGLCAFPVGTANFLMIWATDFVHFGFCLVGGLFCLLMAQFLRRGMELQEENDLTI